MFRQVSRFAVKHRLFFALQPPELVGRRIARWAEHRFGPHGAAVPAERLHVTLDILDDADDFPRDLAERLIELGQTMAADPFFLELDQLSCGGGSIALRPRLRNPGVHSLARGIAEARQGAGIAARSGYRFNPHVTLIYRNAPPFTETVTPFGWEVREFALIHSLVGQTRHITLGSWPLSGRDPDQPDLF